LIPANAEAILNYQPFHSQNGRLRATRNSLAIARIEPSCLKRSRMLTHCSACYRLNLPAQETHESIPPKRGGLILSAR